MAEQAIGGQLMASGWPPSMVTQVAHPQGGMTMIEPAGHAGRNEDGGGIHASGGAFFAPTSGPAQIGQPHGSGIGTSP
jgi:hypothetical protein